MKHPVTWHTARPLWTEAFKDQGNPTRFEQPALLRFSRDSFMEDLAALLQSDPSALKDHVARPETWQQPGAGWLSAADRQLNLPLKLYQPVHGRFYLVAASLVCRIPGLPDRRVDPARQEKASFVLRRLVPNSSTVPVSPSDPTTFTEWAWVVAGQSGRWTPMSAPQTVADHDDSVEERLPMFALTFSDPRGSRRLWLGLVPVGSREAGRANPVISPTTVPAGALSGDFLADPRYAEFDARVAEALIRLRSAIIASPSALTDSQAQNILVFVLFDFASLLHSHLPEILSGTGGSTSARQDLWTRLDTANFFGTTRWRAALVNTWQLREQILAGNTAGTTLPVTGMNLSTIRTAIESVWPNMDQWEAIQKTEGTSSPSPLLELALPVKVKRALGPFNPSSTTTTVAAVDPDAVPKLDPSGTAFYVVRCVYDQPRCLPYHPPLVSARSSTPFQLAPFFDPDAPARPLRVAMPVDTSVAGLRKFPRNVAFLISDQLRRQMSRVQGVKLGDLDSGKLDDESGASLGMICSFSIPIITICALILLLIIVFVLNIVFWWVPFFRICLPLNLKAKG